MSEKDSSFMQMLQRGMTPNDQICFERLFLFEFMVHKVCYDCATSMDPNFLQTLGATCVNFTSDSFPRLDMSEDEFGVCPPFQSIKVKFKSGKSCLFALKKGAESFVSDKAQITVSRKLPPGGCSTEYTFGTAYLKMSPEFLSVLSAGAGISKCLKVSLDIFNCQMDITGSIDIFLRLSCFGTTIITQFQTDSSSDTKSFSFRGDIIPTANPRNNAPTGLMQQHMQLQNVLPNSSCNEKAKEELIVDLLKVIKSSTMFSFLMNNHLVPKGDQILSSVGLPPTALNGILDYYYQQPRINIPQSFCPADFPQVPQYGYNSNNLYSSYGKPTAFSTPLAIEHHNKIGKPQIKPNHIFESYQPNNYMNQNEVFAYEQKGILNSSISENVLCKPVWRSRRSNISSPSRYRNGNTASSRDSIRRNPPSRNTWFAPGPSNTYVCEGS